MSGIIVLDTDNFDTEVYNTNSGLVLVDCWAPWCGPCKALNPVMESLAKKFAGQIKVTKLNVEDEGSLKDKLGVRTLPTVLIFQDGELQATLVGRQPEHAYVDVLTGLMDDLKTDDIWEANLEDSATRQLFLFSGDIGRVRAALDARPSLATEPFDEWGDPLWYALTYARERLDLILEYVPNPSPGQLALLGRDKDLADVLEREPSLVTKNDAKTGLPPIVYCQGKAGCLDVLLRAAALAGENPLAFESADRFHGSLLGTAIAESNLPLLKRLVALGVDPLRLTSPEFERTTLLHQAALNTKSPEILTYLLERGAEPEAKDSDGVTALDLAEKRVAENRDAQPIVDVLKSWCATAT